MASGQVSVSLSWDGGSTYTNPKSVADATMVGSQTNTAESAIDDWDHTWKSSELSNINFRLKLSVIVEFLDDIIEIDYVSIQIFYTIPEMDLSFAIISTLTLITGIILIKKKKII